MDAAQKAALRARLKGDVRVVLEELSGMDAADPDVSSLKGVAAFRAGRNEAAEKYFLRALRLGDSSATNLYYIGLAAQRQGHKADAIAAYKAALIADPGMTKARVKLAELQPHQSSAPSGPRGAGQQKPGSAPQPESPTVPPPTNPPREPTLTSSARLAADDRTEPPGPKENRFLLPRTEAERERYKDEISRVKEIESKAQLRADYKAIPKPVWWAVLAVVVLVVLGFLGFLAVVLNVFQQVEEERQRTGVGSGVLQLVRVLAPWPRVVG